MNEFESDSSTGINLEDLIEQFGEEKDIEMEMIENGRKRRKRAPPGRLDLKGSGLKRPKNEIIQNQGKDNRMKFPDYFDS